MLLLCDYYVGCSYSSCLSNDLKRWRFVGGLLKNVDVTKCWVSTTCQISNSSKNNAVLQNLYLYVFVCCFLMIWRLTRYYCHNWRIKNKLYVTFYFIVLLTGSTCFGHHYAHHQELATMLLITTLAILFLVCCVLDVLMTNVVINNTVASSWWWAESNAWNMLSL